MIPISELQNTPHLCVVGKYLNAPSGIDIYSVWEHVSISHRNNRKLPDWETMCKVKDLFWGKDVTVVQFHPAESAYLHGVNGKKNVLHLWRPKDGNWTVVSEELLKAL